MFFQTFTNNDLAEKINGACRCFTLISAFVFVFCKLDAEITLLSLYLYFLSLLCVCSAV